LRFYFASGLPYSSIVGFYRTFWFDPFEDEPVSGNFRFIQGKRDAERLPDTHRLDLHIDLPIKIRNVRGGVYIDVINVYAHKSIDFYVVDFYDTETGEPLDVPQKTGYSLLPGVPIPSLGIYLKF